MKSGLYGILDDLKVNAVPFITGGAGVVAGLTVGKIAHDLVADFAAPLHGALNADGTPVKAPTDAEAKTYLDNKSSVIRLYVAPLVPVALGIATVVYGRGKVPAMLENAVEGAGLGLAAWGVGKLFTNLTGKIDATTGNVTQPAWVTNYVPSFQGVGEIRGLADNYLRRAAMIQHRAAIQGNAGRQMLPAHGPTPAILRSAPMQGMRGDRSSARPTARSIGAMV